MKPPVAHTLGLLLLSLPALAGEAPVEPPKTNSAIVVPEANLGLQPFIYNGKVSTLDMDAPGPGDIGRDRDKGMGSGVVAENSKVFFTSAHVLYDEVAAWVAPPFWEGIDQQTRTSRGYFRWSSYADQVAKDPLAQNFAPAFAKDIALAWGLTPFSDGTPAKVNYNGYKKLKSKKELSMITGYPWLLDYTQEEPGFDLLHATAPEFTSFVEDASKFLHATHLSTGPGSCGGPMWLLDANGNWTVGGIQVYTRPSEAGIYAFTSASKGLMKAAAPLVGTPRKSISNKTKGISTDTGRYVLPKPKKIPDGVHKWTKIPFKVNRFEEGYLVTGITVDLTVTTNHRGDLMVALLTPSGHMSMLHDGEGAGDDDLVLDNAAPFFTDEEWGELGPVANGTWAILVQDRLTTDQCVVTRLELEVFVQPGTANTEP